MYDIPKRTTAVSSVVMQNASLPVRLSTSVNIEKYKESGSELNFVSARLTMA